MNPVSYDLYGQAPVLVDNVLKMLSPDGCVMQLMQSENQRDSFSRQGLTAVDVFFVVLFEVDAVDQLEGVH